MFSRFFPYDNPLVTLLTENSRKILKPVDPVSARDEGYLRTRLNGADPNIILKKIENQSDRPLYSYKLQFKHAQETPDKTKKAIVYLPGNNPFIDDSLVTMETFVRDVQHLTTGKDDNTTIACFFQHYRGRGANKSTWSENFNDFPIAQDAKDQASLIKYLIEVEGYLPENVMLIGYSYGSMVALWSLYQLATNEDIKYAYIKFFSDRSFGNLFDFPYLIKPFIFDQKYAHQKLHEKEMMPNLFLKEIAAWLPETCIMRVEGDRSIMQNISLSNGFAENELLGRLWVAESECTVADAHYARRDDLQIKYLPQLKFVHLIAAIINERPIKIHFPLVVPKERSYQLKINAAANDTANFIQVEFPISTWEVKSETSHELHLVSNVRNQFLDKLHQYCELRAKRARQSQLGGEFKNNWITTTQYIGWTAKQQIESAIDLMRHLINEDFAAIISMQNDTGPHQSGGLQKIYIELKLFSLTMMKLKEFNQWMSFAKDRRQSKELISQLSEKSIKAEWLLVESTNDVSLLDDERNRCQV